MTTILIRDEMSTGSVFHEILIEVPAECISARELIERRMQTEVTEYNTVLPECFKGLVQPERTEQLLDGYRLRRRRQIDWRKQAAVAVEMFQTNGFILIVDDRQVEDLEKKIEIKPNTQVSFYKLMPLVGG